MPAVKRGFCSCSVVPVFDYFFSCFSVSVPYQMSPEGLRGIFFTAGCSSEFGEDSAD